MENNSMLQQHARGVQKKREDNSDPWCTYAFIISCHWRSVLSKEECLQVLLESAWMQSYTLSGRRADCSILLVQHWKRYKPRSELSCVPHQHLGLAAETGLMSGDNMKADSREPLPGNMKGLCSSRNSRREWRVCGQSVLKYLATNGVRKGLEWCSPTSLSWWQSWQLN